MSNIKKFNQLFEDTNSDLSNYDRIAFDHSKLMMDYRSVFIKDLGDGNTYGTDKQAVSSFKGKLEQLQSIITNTEENFNNFYTRLSQEDEDVYRTDISSTDSSISKNVSDVDSMISSLNTLIESFDLIDNEFGFLRSVKL